MRRSLVVALAVATALAAGASGLAQAPSAGSGKSQEQQVLPPEARYWMGATTGGGILAMAGMAKRGQAVDGRPDAHGHLGACPPRAAVSS